MGMALLTCSGEVVKRLGGLEDYHEVRRKRFFRSCDVSQMPSGEPKHKIEMRWKHELRRDESKYSRLILLRIKHLFFVESHTVISQSFYLDSVIW